MRVSCDVSLTITEISQLESLHIRGCGDVDFRPLWEAKRLRALAVHDPALRDIRMVAAIRSLESLVLESSDVHDLGAMGPLSGLREVVVVDTPLTDLRPLARLSELERLDVSDSYVVDLAPLGGLQSLHTVIAPRARIGSVQSLAALPSLREVDLYDNGVADITPLLDNPALGEGASINLSGNCLDLDDPETAAAIFALRARGVRLAVEPQKPSCGDRSYYGE